jgi:hypothetical protein
MLGRCVVERGEGAGEGDAEQEEAKLGREERNG